MDKLFRWFKNNMMRSIPVTGLLIAVIVALINGDNYIIERVLTIAVWFIPLLLLPELQKLVEYYKAK